MIQKEEIILASTSPRRKELLENARIKFNVVASSFDETTLSKFEPEDYVKLQSYKKTEDVANIYKKTFVIGADTIVVVDSSILGKPKDENDAFLMLESLSNKAHFVFTAYTIINITKNIVITNLVKTEVFFKLLSKQEISWYIKTGEPFDKAGAYAIQGLGSFFIEKISGSYSNVIGLPVCEVVLDLIKLNILEFY